MMKNKTSCTDATNGQEALDKSKCRFTKAALSRSTTSNHGVNMQPSILKIFLSITQEQIQRGLDEPEKLLSKFQQKYFPKGKWRRPSTPEEKALWFHHNLVLASTMHAHGESPSEKIM